MKNAKFLYNAALVFGLAAAAPVFADDAATVNPSTMTQQEREAYRSQRQAEMSGMTQQEREAYRTQRQSEMSGMTPEQRGEAQARNRSGWDQGQGTMARDGSGTGGQYGRNGGGAGMGGGKGGMGGGHGRGR